jgi:hypothetical protein
LRVLLRTVLAGDAIVAVGASWSIVEVEEFSAKAGAVLTPSVAELARSCIWTVPSEVHVTVKVITVPLVPEIAVVAQLAVPAI